MVEVDRFPDIQHHRAGLAGGQAGGGGRQNVVGAGPEPAVEGLADAVQAAVRVCSKERRSGVAGAWGEDDLGRAQELGAADHGAAVADAVGELFVVAAPGQVRGPDLAVAVAEAGGAGGQKQGGVVSGAAVPAGADPGALLDGAALRVAFTAPAPGEVQEFDGVRGHREDGRQSRRPGTGVVPSLVTVWRSSSRPPSCSVREEETVRPASGSDWTITAEVPSTLTVTTRRRAEKSRPETPSTIRCPRRAARPRQPDAAWGRRPVGTAASMDDGGIAAVRIARSGSVLPRSAPQWMTSASRLSKLITRLVPAERRWSGSINDVLLRVWK